VRRAALVALVGSAAFAAAGCGSSSSAGPTVSVGAARTYHLADFALDKPVAGRPAKLSFAIDQPSGAPITAYRTGPGPHTGVHVILVRQDLGAIIHKHPRPTANGTVSEDITFPTGGRWRLIADAYPAQGPRNFQLFRWITVGGKAPAAAPQPQGSAVTAGGDRFVMGKHAPLRAIQAAFLNVKVTDANGQRSRFTPWFGALAHAIFFREGTLDYFHTHVCGAGTTGCTAAFGPRVVGSSTAPGRLRVGVLLPVAGTWRMFLQTKINGQVVTAPFTLAVR
jgi:hypothetical protein